MAGIFKGLGGGKGGGAKKPASADGKDKKAGGTSDFLKKRAAKKGKVDSKVSHEELLKSKMEELKKELGQSKYHKFTLPGTDPNQERKLSKAAEEAMAKIAEKRAKREQKKNGGGDGSTVVPRRFGELGRMDAKGNIMDATGRVVMKVDPATGKIKNRNGVVVGKYDPESSYNGYKIEKLIQKYTIVARPAAVYAATTVEGAGMEGTGWGGAPEIGPATNTIADFWGESSDDGPKGW